MNRKHSIFANAAKTMAMIWRVGILGIAMCAVPLVGCSELETLLNGEEDEEEEVIENPFKEYDDSPEAMILKWKTQPTEGLYGSGALDKLICADRVDLDGQIIKDVRAIKYQKGSIDGFCHKKVF